MIMLSNATTNTTCMLGLLAPLSFKCDHKHHLYARIVSSSQFQM